MKSTTAVENELNLILGIIDQAGKPLSRSEIQDLISFDIGEKTLQRRLKKLVEGSQIAALGQRSAVKYVSLAYAKDTSSTNQKNESWLDDGLLLSEISLTKLKCLETPSYARTKVSYNSSLIEDYVPNKTRYVSENIANKLRMLGQRFNKKLAAGTYAKDIAQRLLIDLSFNSSRLEGNTYSILDTERLLQAGEAADGKFDEETIMILNHKEAIMFLIENAEELSVTPFVIRNLHQLLSQDLLPDSLSCGKIRQVEVKITKTSYLPLNASQQLEEIFTLLLRKAEKIHDPFEQSFFLLIHLSYLQAFVDVNKRTARLSCNLPFIKDNLCPLSFIDVPKDDYVQTLIYFYETGDYEPALEVFVWAYERSSQQYDVVEKSIGVIDSYRIKYRSERKQALGQIIREMVVGEAIISRLEQFCIEHHIPDTDKFISIATVELSKLHSGAIVSLGVTENMFRTWKEKFDTTNYPTRGG
ncbi:MAG: Fic family protein [Vibrio sp.]|uniref:Fic family protein n=1 Tax=Vibrio sp. TaxID=678 RepID=UPI003A89D510